MTHRTEQADQLRKFAKELSAAQIKLDEEAKYVAGGLGALEEAIGAYNGTLDALRAWARDVGIKLATKGVDFDELELQLRDDLDGALCVLENQEEFGVDNKHTRRLAELVKELRRASDDEN